MQIKMKTLLAAAALVALAGSVPLPAQTKVGVIDFQNALLATAEMQKAAASLEARLKPRRDEIEKLQQELQEIQEKLQSAQGAEAIGLQNDGQRKQRDAQRKSEDLQSDYEFERNTILQAAARKMREVVNKLAEEKGLDLVVDVGDTLYFKPALELSKDATAAYDLAHPVTSP